VADRVRDACEACFDANADDCSGFVSAVAIQLGIDLEGLADQIVDTIRHGNDWARLPDGLAAAQNAALGQFVVAGLKGSEQAKPDLHGHVASSSMGLWQMAGTQMPTGDASVVVAGNIER